MKNLPGFREVSENFTLRYLLECRCETYVFDINLKWKLCTSFNILFSIVQNATAKQTTRIKVRSRAIAVHCFQSEALRASQGRAPWRSRDAVCGLYKSTPVAERWCVFRKHSEDYCLELELPEVPGWLHDHEMRGDRLAPLPVLAPLPLQIYPNFASKKPGVQVKHRRAIVIYTSCNQSNGHSNCERLPVLCTIDSETYHLLHKHCSCSRVLSRPV